MPPASSINLPHPFIIDSHVHAFPDRIKRFTPELAKAPIEEFRKRARAWLKPVLGSVHRVQTVLRHLPEPARRALDEIGALAPIPSLFVESSPADLADAMTESNISHALLIASPPMATNEFVLEACAQDPRLLPVAYLPSGTSRSGNVLRELVNQGAIALKIHPAFDGEGVDSPRYKALLKVADEMGLPVIIHTGCFHAHLYYKAPEQSQAQRYVPWFEKYTNVRFVLAHMNFHEPAIAMDIMEEHPNVYADTSWQPAEVIGEAVRRVGSDRILFGTDWPLVGNNFDIGLARVRDSVETGMITEDDANAILGANAAKLFEIEPVSEAETNIDAG
jgi:predicted TIM-barrel fold metal-dependent hydrolase